MVLVPGWQTGWRCTEIVRRQWRLLLELRSRLKTTFSSELGRTPDPNSSSNSFWRPEPIKECESAKQSCKKSATVAGPWLTTPTATSSSGSGNLKNEASGPDKTFSSGSEDRLKVRLHFCLPCFFFFSLHR